MTGALAVVPALSVAGSVELAHLERDGIVESRHIGAAAVVDAAGQLLGSWGDVDATVFPRSALKLVQAVAMLRLGAQFADDELVLAAASHCGSPEHLAVVERMLHDDGRDESHLHCPAQWPRGSAQRAERQAAGLGPSPLAMNCSGKHAGFLRATDAIGADPARYLLPDHPVQKAIRATTEQLTNQPVRAVSTDGCGAPLFATSLAALARATAVVASGQGDAESRLMAAVRAEPWAIDGHGRENTRVIQQLGGIAKLGAEGVVVIGTTAGVAVAVKVLDGSMRATTPVALTLLAAVGAIDRAIAGALIENLSERVMAGARELGRLVVDVG